MNLHVEKVLQPNAASGNNSRLQCSLSCMFREAEILLECKSVVGQVVPDVWKYRGVLESWGNYSP